MKYELYTTSFLKTFRANIWSKVKNVYGMELMTKGLYFYYEVNYIYIYQYVNSECLCHSHGYINGYFCDFPAILLLYDWLDLAGLTLT